MLLGWVFLPSHHILMCCFTSFGYFRECEVTGNTWHTHQVFSISESPLRRYHHVFQHSFFSVSERDEWMNLCSQQNCLDGRDIPYRHPPHRRCRSSTLKLLIFHLPVLHTKYHAPEGSRVGWGITISNLPFAETILQASSFNTSIALIYKGCFSAQPNFTTSCTDVGVFLLCSLEHQLGCGWLRGTTPQSCGVILLVHSGRTRHTWAAVSLSCRCTEKFWMICV